eukprot:TRINITY_DN19184_c0_g1_i1.p1 TRINITY_DN19184_c0_g1~~TRINITY_DN19184_c0_g1_i1.p1  ORF type:complete len:154 (-),score=5.56 TRINITY_DN19184_c0_g1_i1:64-525(-)
MRQSEAQYGTGSGQSVSSVSHPLPQGQYFSILPPSTTPDSKLHANGTATHPVKKHLDEINCQLQKVQDHNNAVELNTISFEVNQGWNQAPFLDSDCYWVGYAYLNAHDCAGNLWIDPAGGVQFSGDVGAWGWESVDDLLAGVAAIEVNKTVPV